MFLRNMLELDISPVQSVVEIADTSTGTEEGLDAGARGIGLAISGNEVGVSLEAWSSHSEALKQTHRDHIYPTTSQRGAHRCPAWATSRRGGGAGRSPELASRSRDRRNSSSAPQISAISSSGSRSA
jgi:hypothetical protein